jgi:hypothetical protein
MNGAPIFHQEGCPAVIEPVNALGREFAERKERRFGFGSHSWL